MRTVADVAAVADNIPLFNSMVGGWLTVSGTSASAPLIAGIYALAGNIGTGRGHLYQRADALFDITVGANDSTGTGSK
jgi:subtilase family serine protease